MEKDETSLEPIDEVGQLLSDIQEEEESSTLSEINEEQEDDIDHRCDVDFIFGFEYWADLHN